MTYLPREASREVAPAKSWPRLTPSSPSVGLPAQHDSLHPFSRFPILLLVNKDTRVIYADFGGPSMLLLSPDSDYDSSPLFHLAPRLLLPFVCCGMQRTAYISCKCKYNSLPALFSKRSSTRLLFSISSGLVSADYSKLLCRPRPCLKMDQCKRSAPQEALLLHWLLGPSSHLLARCSLKLYMCPLDLHPHVLQPAHPFFSFVPPQ